MDLRAGELRKNGRRVSLQPQPFELLAALVLRAPDMVMREELYEKLSNHSSYDPKHGLNNAIQKIREALDDSSSNSRFLETVRGRGYRFLLPVEPVSNGFVKEYSRELPARDLFLEAVAQIRQELICAFSAPKLSELLYRVSDLIDQNEEHSEKYQARMLLDQIELAINRSGYGEANAKKHKISLETASEVFDDPNALSLYEGSGLWRTLGRVCCNIGPVRQRVLITVSHYVLTGETGQEQVMIKAARKATERERNMYEQNQSKTGE